MRVVGFVYMLQCADGSYYVGSHRGDDVDTRIQQHNEGINTHSYTFRRRPVELVWSDCFYRFDELVACERQIKGWSRAKKEALIRGDRAALKELSARGVKLPDVADPSRRIDHSMNDQSSSG
ncbi:GIY-YIG nuclease family protein [Hyphococcus flavus]|uniref:GIY-YIG nuclease family protein n=1 Tax=Hyphococcus flavus TaxID=1866326 RepID=A0AAE9ZAL4_9PROT|nr:GIY-YIG nuclease family protein [Hyphococcus flavus]WDI30804.1 GIY-YIG nuclease family protein [Hyphococcus flavus]